MTAPGPFRRNGLTPSGIGLPGVARTEATREVVGYLSANGCLGEGLNWEALAGQVRENWVKAITEVFTKANREAAKAAVAELAEYEELALLVECPRCGAEEEEPCRDQRVRYIRAVKHPHPERVTVMEGQL